MKKITSLLLMVLLTISLLGGCGSNDNSKNIPKNEETGETAAEVNQDEKQGEKIKVQIWELESVRSYMEQMVQEYNQNNPDTEIEVVYSSTDDLKNNLKVAASSRTLPDAWFSWGGSLGSFYADNGLTVDLTQIAEEENWDEIYLQAMLDLCTYNGELSGIPRQANSMGIFYRKDIFDKYGLQPPASLAEFEALMETLKQNDITPISTGGKFSWLVMRKLEALMEAVAGPELHDKLMKMEESWDNQKVVEVFEKLKEWTDKGYFPEGFITLDPAEAKIPLYAGEAAMVFEGPWMDTTFVSDQQDPNLYGFFPFPTDQPKVRMSGFTEMYQFNKASSEEIFNAALKFAKYATSVETISKYADRMQFPKATLGAVIPESMPNVKTIVDYMDKGGTFLVADQALPQEIVQKLFQAQDSVITGMMTPEEAAKFMKDEITKYNN